jgi:hypothetical protein
LGARLANDHELDISKSSTSRHDASARRFPAGRPPGFRAIAATSATARSKTADQFDGSTSIEFGCAYVLFAVALNADDRRHHMVGEVHGLDHHYIRS